MFANERLSDGILTADHAVLGPDRDYQGHHSDLSADVGKLNVDFNDDARIDLSEESNRLNRNFDSLAKEGSPKDGIKDDTDMTDAQGCGSPRSNAILEANEGLPSINFNGDVNIVPNGLWDSSDCGRDLEATEYVSEPTELDFTINEDYDIPLDIQLIWYEWILYQLDECIDRERIFSGRKSAMVISRGTLGPLENLKTLVSRFQNRDLEDPGPFGQIFYQAINFRHTIEHRFLSMKSCYLTAAIEIPRLLGDKPYYDRLNEVYFAITNKFTKAKSKESATSSASNSSTNEVAFKDVFETISQPLNFDYCPHLGLLYNFVEKIRRAAFDWAICTHPGYFSVDDNYKAYDPKYWANDYPYCGPGAECEGAKTAFFNKHCVVALLKGAFHDWSEIRNYFIHRKPSLKQKEIDWHSPKSFFWNLKRSAVKLALLLGEIDLALHFEKNIRVFHSDFEKTEEILEEFREDEVEAAVKGLMSGPGEQREAVLSSKLFRGEKAFIKQMRRRWVCFHILMEGEYMIRVDRDGSAMVEGDNAWTYEEDDEELTDDASSDEPKTPPTWLEEPGATSQTEWDWSKWSSLQPLKPYVATDGENGKEND